jgi:hypothetical protein
MFISTFFRRASLPSSLRYDAASRFALGCYIVAPLGLPNWAAGRRY